MRLASWGWKDPSRRTLRLYCPALLMVSKIDTYSSSGHSVLSTAKGAL